MAADNGASQIPLCDNISISRAEFATTRDSFLQESLPRAFR